MSSGPSAATTTTAVNANKPAPSPPSRAQVVVTIASIDHPPTVLVRSALSAIHDAAVASAGQSCGMKVWRGCRPTVVAAGLAALTACGGSSQRADRVGNPVEPVVVTVLTEEHPISVAADMLSLFAIEVDARSDGAVRIEPAFGVIEEGVAWDQRAIEATSSGQFDAVVARAGAWHSGGVTSLDVLQLPGLVDTDNQADRLAGDAEAVDALVTGLTPIGFTGLGLYPEGPRYLMHLDGTDRFDLDTLAGRPIRAPLSETVFAVLRAAGLAPVDVGAGDFLVSVSDGDIPMTEGHLARVELTNTVDDSSTPSSSGPTWRSTPSSWCSPFAPTPSTSPPSTCCANPPVASARRSPTSDPPKPTAPQRPARRAHRSCRSRPTTGRRSCRPCSRSSTASKRAPTEPSSAWCGRPPARPPAPTGPVPNDRRRRRRRAAPAAPLAIPARRADVEPTPGDVPDGVYRFVVTPEAIAATGAPDEGAFVGEWILRAGHAELHYFELDGTPMDGEPPDLGGTYQVQGDTMVFATPPERAMPGTSGMYLLRWTMDDDTLLLTQLDDGRHDVDFAVPWVRVGEAP